MIDHPQAITTLGGMTSLCASMLISLLLVLGIASSVAVHAEVLQMEYSERTRILEGAICLTARNDLPARVVTMTAAQRAAASVDEVCQFRADILVGTGPKRQPRTLEVSANEEMPFGREQEVCLDARWQLHEHEKILEVIGIGYRCFPRAAYQQLLTKSHPPPMRRSEVMSYLQRPAYAAILNMPYLSGE